MTKDYVAVLHHGSKKQSSDDGILSVTYDQLNKHVPHLATLQELLQTSLQSPLLLDLKTTATKELIQLLIQYPRKNGSCFTSPYPQVLATLKKVFPSIEVIIAQKFSKGPFKAIQLARMN